MFLILVVVLFFFSVCILRVLRLVRRARAVKAVKNVYIINHLFKLQIIKLALVADYFANWQLDWCIGQIYQYLLLVLVLVLVCPVCGQSGGSVCRRSSRRLNQLIDVLNWVWSREYHHV